MWLAIFCKLSDEFSVVDFSRNFNKNASTNYPGGSPEAPRTIPARFLTHSTNSLRILSPKRAARKVIWGQIWDPLGPAGDPKMLKNRAGEIFEASREGPGAVPNRIFDRRGCETRSNSIFGRFLDPSDPYETLRMAANLKVFRFANRGSKKSQNRGLRLPKILLKTLQDGPFWGGSQNDLPKIVLKTLQDGPFWGGSQKTEGVGWPRDAYFGVGCKKWKASGGLETPRNAIFDCPPLPHFMIMVVVSVVAHVTLGGASIVGYGEG